jgi:hypothetical protein
VSTLNGQWLEIFRAGNYGPKGVFTAADLNKLATTYDPAKHEAPICVGHPEMDAPAFGWMKQLKVEGDTLFGLPGEVNPDFEAAVKSGAYKKRSVAFTRQQDGTLSLRHVGFLGAFTPEVKGLRDAKFSDAKYDEIEFSEGEEMDQVQLKKTFMESLREIFSEKQPAQAATITQEQIDAAVAKAVGTVETKFAADLKTERDARVAVELQFAEHQKKVGSASADARVTALIGGLKASKRWLRAYDKMGVPALFAALASGATTEIEFGEGTEKKKVDPVQLFADILNGIGQIVPEGIAFAAATGTKTGAIPSGNGVEVESSSVTFNEQVTAYAVENKVSFNDAYRTLISQGKRPVSGDATAGAV